MSVPKSYWSLVILASLSLTPLRAVEITAGEKEALATAHQGSVLMLSNLWSQQRELPLIPLKITDAHGPQFLFSDKPEYFSTGNGISLQEEVKPGVVRLYIYHVPQPTNGPKTISAVIENLGKKTLEFRFRHRAFSEPSRDYLLIGKNGLIGFFNSRVEQTIRRLAPGARMVIDPAMDEATAITDQLVHGFYEFEINQPACVTVFERDPGQSSLEIIDHLPKLPRDLPGHTGSGAGRGLFLISDYNVTAEPGFVLDTTNGPMRLMLADGKTEPPITGSDEIAETNSVKDSGNYGVMYRVRIQRSSSDSRGLALCITKPSRGGKWCGSQSGAVQVSSGIWPGGTVAIPSDRVAFSNPGEMVLIQKFPPVHQGWTDTIEILYSPLGASCIPTPMVLVPY